jgi:hypothetical protein
MVQLGFWSATIIRARRRHQICYSITVRLTTPIRAALCRLRHLTTTAAQCKTQAHPGQRERASVDPG